MSKKLDYDKTLTRLLVIISRLNDGESLSVKELADEFAVSTRTVQRDFNERLVSLFPIYQDRKVWRMMDGHKIEKTRDNEDTIVLQILEKMTSSIGGRFALRSKAMLDKLKNDDNPPIYAKLNLEDIGDHIDDIALLSQAIKVRQTIVCVYGDKTDRAIDPLKIVNYEGFWYLVAKKEQKIHKYYLKDISNIRPTKHSFEVSKSIDELLENSISIWFNQDKTPYKVSLKAHKYIAKYFYRRPLPTQQIIKTNEDGSLEFEVSITSDMEISPIVKYWIPYLKVVRPKSIADSIDEDIQEYLKDS
ncbi:MAG: transcriptional regulator [Epsilonproteobacteria bacterium]|nr:MAG: transcriptional regulator [Campylobacterota bacterium]